VIYERPQEICAKLEISEYLREMLMLSLLSLPH
jgi:hypothetical protein